MLYTQYETIKFAMKPLSKMLSTSLAIIDAWNQNYPKLSSVNNYRQARYSLTNNLIKDYPKLPWGIQDIVDSKNLNHKVIEKVIIDKPFCEFKLFTVEGLENRPALIMAAPLSGHYATLLRDTLQNCLKDYDVYVTDWKNCRDIPIKEGDFDFQNYVEYIIEFSKYVKDKHKQTNILAVCQPTVPVAIAAAYLAKNDPNYTFDNVVLMGGPLDTRKSPTKVNQYALKHPIDWFQKNVIKSVPFYFKGVGRKVYPGFLQHMGFLSMNMKRHTKAHVDFFNDLIKGANLDAQKHQEFYNEYNAVMDLPAAYYLDTLKHVFLDQSLAKDKMEIFGQKISMSDIKDGRYLLLEGELDDISGSGQTYAAYDMLTNLPVDNKKKYMAENVGHYGIFAGKGFRNNIYPVIKAFIHNEDLQPEQKNNVNQNGDVLHIHKNKKIEVLSEIPAFVENVEEPFVQEVAQVVKEDVKQSTFDFEGIEKVISDFHISRKQEEKKLDIQKVKAVKSVVFPKMNDYIEVEKSIDVPKKIVKNSTAKQVVKTLDAKAPVVGKAVVVPKTNAKKGIAKQVLKEVPKRALKGNIINLKNDPTKNKKD